jgi:hypothetical protein
MSKVEYLSLSEKNERPGADSERWEECVHRLNGSLVVAPNDQQFSSIFNCH